MPVNYQKYIFNSTGITINWPGIIINIFLNSNYQQLNSNFQQYLKKRQHNNYQQFARIASVIIYKIYRFRSLASRRKKEKIYKFYKISRGGTPSRRKKRKIHKIHKISLACEQEKNLQDFRDFARGSEQEILLRHHSHNTTKNKILPVRIFLVLL